MKNVAMVFAAVLIGVVVTGSALAGPPLDGVYPSTDLGGAIPNGRYTESFLVPNGATDIGTTFNAASWDGMTLGASWRYYCSTILVAPTVTVDNVDANGNGNRTYMKTFSGGFVWLSGTGPWANGDPDYPGTIDTYVEFETVQYVNFDRVAAVTNVQATAHFDDYPDACLTFVIANGHEVGSPPPPDTKPGDYPGLLQQGTCLDVMTLGAWWDMTQITLYITGCTNPTKETTWGAVKSLYNE